MSRKPGRPRKDTTAVSVRVPRDVLKEIDAMRLRGEAHMSRPEAIRKLVAIGLSVVGIDVGGVSPVDTP